MYRTTLLTLAALAVTSAFDLPDNLKQIHDDHLGSNGNYDNMGIDCDGVNNSSGACPNDPSGQSETASKVTVQSFSINNLDVNLHLYVVFGNKGANPSFSPKQFSIQPLSVIAVVCNNQVVSHQSIHNSELCQAISMGNLCFPNDGLTGDNSHDPKDVLYTGFMGQQAIPGANGADWSAGNTANFKNSITYLRDNLVASLQA
ncbi:glycoside hydrolase family 75 protein [Trichoderma austrokoningii]